MPGERYWAMVEPIWGKISKYDGADRFLSDYTATPGVPPSLFAAHWCVSEISNGGLHQLFFNSTGVLAPEAAVAFELIGLPTLAHTLCEAMTKLGPNYPRDRDERQPHLAKSDEQGESFKDLEGVFYELLQHESGGWEAVADAYALRIV